MELHWHAPKHSRHGDLVDLIAPYPFGPYEIEFGMVPTGDRPPRYYVRCCDHDGRTLPPWEVTFPTATEAKAFAERRVIERALNSGGTSLQTTRWLANSCRV